MPDGYGVPDHPTGLIEWARVRDRLESATEYWLATTRSDGRPHVVPRWGVWLGDTFWYDGSPETLHVRNLAHNPSCALHLEDGRRAVIVEGISAAAQPPGAEFGAELAAAFTAKYADLGYAPAADAWEGPQAGGLRSVTPLKAMAWFDFPKDVTRFRFPD